MGAIEKGLSETGEKVGHFINETDLPDEEVAEILRNWQLNQEQEIASITNWTNAWNAGVRKRSSSIFNQDAYVIPDNIFDQMRTAAYAAKYDDIVANAVDITEQIAFKRIGIESSEDESSDIGKQILDQLNMVQVFREIWRELFITSNCYVAVRWGRKSFRLKEPTNNPKGRKRKKIYKDLLVPTAISILDPLKVIPVGNFLFGEERLAYIADPEEAVSIDQSLASYNSTDLNVTSMFVEKYKPSREEAQLINGATNGHRSRRAVDLNLYILNPEVVFRITATRPSYQRFADVRMASVFELLDLKHNLRESDRSDILGNINSLVVVKKGDRDTPTTAQELRQTAAQFRGNGRNSVVVTDHRISVEIITKKTDKTLQPERYNTIDSRLTARLFQLFQTGNYATGTATDNSGTLFKIAAASMDARREHIRDIVSNKIIERIWEFNDVLKGEPSLVFYPRRIALDFDHHYSTLLKELMVLGRISGETMLDELDVDFQEEMARVDDEFVKYGAPGQRGDQDVVNGIKGGIYGGNANGGGSNTRSYAPSPNNGRGPSGDEAPDSDVKE